MGLRLVIVMLVVHRLLKLLLGRIAHATAHASARAAARWKQRVLMTMPQVLSASVQSRSAIGATTDTELMQVSSSYLMPPVVPPCWLP